jgi:hypothetical protein
MHGEAHIFSTLAEAGTFGQKYMLSKVQFYQSVPNHAEESPRI